MKKIQMIAIAVLFLTACNKDMNEVMPSSTGQTDVASDSNLKKCKHTRPFSINFYTTVDTNSAIPPTPCSGDLPGFANAGYFLHGTASHMGLINVAGSRGQDVSCNLSFTTALLTTSVAGEITSACGDKIFYTGNDEINVFNLLTNSGTTGTITGLWTITGGTGKFAGATGSFPINGPVDFTTSTFSITGTGTITY